jgi:hypothetical protein
MSFRAYQEFKFAPLNGSGYTWAGTTYSDVMLKSDISLPDELSVRASTAYSVPMSDNVYTGDHTFSMIVPDVFDLVNAIDGTIRGITTMAATLNDGHGSDYVKINSCSIGIVAVDGDGNERDILETTVIDSTVVQSVQYDGTTTRTFIWWLDVPHAEISAAERLRIDYTLNYTTYDYLGDDSGSISMPNEINGDQNSIIIPFVMS